LVINHYFIFGSTMLVYRFIVKEIHWKTYSRFCIHIFCFWKQRPVYSSATYIWLAIYNLSITRQKTLKFEFWKQQLAFTDKLSHTHSWTALHMIIVEIAIQVYDTFKLRVVHCNQWKKTTLFTQIFTNIKIIFPKLM
jgi:hypothetical protein